MSTTQWKVTGMTCGHCEGSVTKNIQAIPGVTSVSIELHPNEVSIVTTESDVELDRQSIIDALSDSGSYELI